MTTSPDRRAEAAETTLAGDPAAVPAESAELGAPPTGAEEAEAAAPAEDVLVPRAMRIAGAWSWRIIAVVLAMIPIGWVISQASILVIPLLVATLLAALLRPLYSRLLAWRWPKGLALIATLLALFLAVGALLALVVSAFSGGFHLDMGRLQTQYQTALQWLRDSPLHVTEQQITAAVEEVTSWVQSNVSSIVSGAVTAGSTVVSIATGSLVTLFALIFYLLDGRRIWLFIVGLFPRPARAAVDGAARRGWVSVGHYARVQVIVALIDAVGITIGALFLNVPFAIPIGIIVFLAAFVPFLGAIASGGLAVLVALVYNDLWNALIMLAVVIAVMQIEAHILQPLIMGNAVEIHPLAVLLSVSAGSLFAGIAGAVFAVPIVAALKVAIQYIASEEWRGQPDPTKLLPPDDPDELPAGARAASALVEAVRSRVEAHGAHAASDDELAGAAEVRLAAAADTDTTSAGPDAREDGGAR